MSHILFIFNTSGQAGRHAALEEMWWKSGAQELWPKQTADYGEDEWEKELFVKLSPPQMNECSTLRNQQVLRLCGSFRFLSTQFRRKWWTVSKRKHSLMCSYMLIFLTFSFSTSTQWVMVTVDFPLESSMNRRRFYSCLYKTIIAAVNCWGSSFNEHQNKFNDLQLLINKHRNLLVGKYSFDRI